MKAVFVFIISHMYNLLINLSLYVTVSGTVTCFRMGSVYTFTRAYALSKKLEIGFQPYVIVFACLLLPCCIGLTTCFIGNRQ